MSIITIKQQTRYTPGDTLEYLSFPDDFYEHAHACSLRLRAHLAVISDTQLCKEVLYKVIGALTYSQKESLAIDSPRYDIQCTLWDYQVCKKLSSRLPTTGATNALISWWLYYYEYLYDCVRVWRWWSVASSSKRFLKTGNSPKMQVE